MLGHWHHILTDNIITGNLEVFLYLQRTFPHIKQEQINVYMDISVGNHEEGGKFTSPLPLGPTPPVPKKLYESPPPLPF